METGGGWEATFVQNMIRTRERLRMSQTELAKKMSAEGFAFHQPTIARVESGARPVRLNEAQAITQILFGGDWDRAVRPAGEGALRAVVIEQSKMLSAELVGLLSSLEEDVKRVRQLGVTLLGELGRYRQACEVEGVAEDPEVKEHSTQALGLFLLTLKGVAELRIGEDSPLTVESLADLEWLSSKIDERWAGLG